MSEPKNILKDVGRYIFDLYKEKLSHNYVYHNYQHTLETVEACKKIAKGYLSINEEELEILLLAAWFHDTGYIYSYENHEEKSKEIAKEYLQGRNYESDRIEKVLNCIHDTYRESEPKVMIGKILADADIVSVGEKGFFTKAELLRTEWENFDIKHCTEIEWAETQLEFLQSITFHTQEAQKLYGEQLQFNIQEQRRKLQELNRKKEKKKKKRNKIKAQPKRGIETMFRSIYRSHINLSSIADNKANMMISINSLIISITLTLVGAKLSLLGASFQQTQVVIYPVISLLLTSLGAIIFAILSAKPTVSKKGEHLEEIKKENLSILFFGTYTQFTVEDFEYQMKELMKNENELYGNMIRDLYLLGKVLSKKYALIKISYLVFMIGLIITVLVTVWVVIYLKGADDGQVLKISYLLNFTQ